MGCELYRGVWILGRLFERHSSTAFSPLKVFGCGLSKAGFLSIWEPLGHLDIDRIGALPVWEC